MEDIEEMPREDQLKWDAKYQADAAAWSVASPAVTALVDYLPAGGTALDVAGGVGRHALWLAKQGLCTTLVDISPVALDVAAESARSRAVSLDCCQRDVEQDGLPPGEWDIVLTHHFLFRPLFDAMRQSLKPGGRLMVVQPTVENLQRHARPPRPFLLEPNEILTLIGDLNVLHHCERWSDKTGRHEAVLVAEKR